MPDRTRPPHCPCALAYAALIVYASLYPFADWRDQGIAPWAFLAAPLAASTGPASTSRSTWSATCRSASWLALTVLRTRPAAGAASAVLRATLAGAAISFAMETLQSYLPARIPSNVDLALNIAGALAGAVLAAGARARWAPSRTGARLRARWFVDDARGALVLLALWPFALLFPAAVPFGLGQVLERLEDGAGRAAGRHAVPRLAAGARVRTASRWCRASSCCACCSGALVPCLLAIHRARARPAPRVLLLAAASGRGVAATRAVGRAELWARRMPGPG